MYAFVEVITQEFIPFEELQEEELCYLPTFEFDEDNQDDEDYEEYEEYKE